MVVLLVHTGRETRNTTIHMPQQESSMSADLASTITPGTVLPDTSHAHFRKTVTDNEERWLGTAKRLPEALLFQGDRERNLHSLPNRVDDGDEPLQHDREEDDHRQTATAEPPQFSVSKNQALVVAPQRAFQQHPRTALGA